MKSRMTKRKRILSAVTLCLAALLLFSTNQENNEAYSSLRPSRFLSHTKISTNDNLVVINAIGKINNLPLVEHNRRHIFKPDSWDCIIFNVATDEMIPDSNEYIETLQNELECSIIRKPGSHWGDFLMFVLPSFVSNYEYVTLLLDDVYLPSEGHLTLNPDAVIEKMKELNIGSMQPVIINGSYGIIDHIKEMNAMGCIVPIEKIETYVQFFSREAWECFYEMLDYRGSKGWCYDVCMPKQCPHIKEAYDARFLGYHMDRSMESLPDDEYTQGGAVIITEDVKAWHPQDKVRYLDSNYGTLSGSVICDKYDCDMTFRSGLGDSPEVLQCPHLQEGLDTIASTDEVAIVENNEEVVPVENTEEVVPVENEEEVAAPPVSIDASMELLNHYKDISEPLDSNDLPMFFHIPKSGGSAVKEIIAACHRFTLASEVGVRDDHINDTELAVVYPKLGIPGAFLSPFVNIDPTTPLGIQRAIDMGFPASNHMADVVVTPYLYEANGLFTPTSKGRMFAVFRHPIERSLSLFYYLQYADWEPTFQPELRNWTVAQYATSDKFENNWLTRQLTNELEGELTDAHLDLAMEIIRRKFLVGLTTRMEDTVTRFERFFHWPYTISPEDQETCRQEYLSGKVNSNTKNKHNKPAEGSEEWNLLAEQNNYDLQLYAFVEALFDDQEALVADVPVTIRLDQATCCACEPATFQDDGLKKCPETVIESEGEVITQTAL